jgi:hypothetical protein
LIDIRPATDADLEQARLCISKGCAEPNWKFCHVVVRDGRVVGIIEIETVLTGDVHMLDGAKMPHHCLRSAGLKGRCEG